MLKIIVIISFVTLLSTKIFPQNFWEKIDSPTSKRLNSLVFIDSINGWVAGDSGLIIHTSNGGLDWETQYSNDSLRVVNIFFLNDQIGWCSALSEFYEPYGTYILKTTNGTYEMRGFTPICLHRNNLNFITFIAIIKPS